MQEGRSLEALAELSREIAEAIKNLSKEVGDQ
jgi:hypothetical protein